RKTLLEIRVQGVVYTFDHLVVHGDFLLQPAKLPQCDSKIYLGARYAPPQSQVAGATEQFDQELIRLDLVCWAAHLAYREAFEKERIRNLHQNRRFGRATEALQQLVIHIDLVCRAAQIPQTDSLVEHRHRHRYFRRGIIRSAESLDDLAIGAYG